MGGGLLSLLCLWKRIYVNVKEQDKVWNIVTPETEGGGRSTKPCTLSTTISWCVPSLERLSLHSTRFFGDHLWWRTFSMYDFGVLVGYHIRGGSYSDHSNGVHTYDLAIKMHRWLLLFSPLDTFCIMSWFISIAFAPLEGGTFRLNVYFAQFLSNWALWRTKESKETWSPTAFVR